jgi:hypothetical protein
MLHIGYNGLGGVLWNALLISLVGCPISKDLEAGTDFAKYKVTMTRKHSKHGTIC